MDWGTVREYNYKKSVAVLPVRTAVTAVFSLLGIVCELIFFFVNDHAGQTFFALLYVLLKLTSPTECPCSARRNYAGRMGQIA